MLNRVARKRRKGGYDKGYTREHLVPLSRGGKSGSNIVLAHSECNKRRGNSIPDPLWLDRAAHIHCAANAVTI